MKACKAALITWALMTAGCDVTDPPAIDEGGVVHFVEVEGGCWVIDAESGIRYEPINLPEAFRIDGIRVSFEGDVLPDYASICMVGQILELSRIESLED